MRTQATEAQKEAAKLRREKFRGIVKTIAKMPEADRIALSQRVGVVSCEGGTYSLHNQCLIASQCPNATVLGGFRQWKKQGRTVRRGEHGQMIWVPSVYEVSEDTPQPSEIDGEEKKTGVRFLIGTVFDISQTEELGQEAEGDEVAA